MEHLVQTGKSINSVTEKLKEGDVVLVESGKYEDKVLLKVPRVTYRSLEKYGAQVAQFFFMETGHYIEIDGFDFVWGNIEMAGSPNHNNLFHNNRIHHGGSCGIDFGQGCENTIMEDNEIFNVGHGIHTSGGTKNLIARRNIIHDCRAHGLGMVGGIGEKYLDNIIYNCGKTGIHPGSGGPSNGEIRGNLVYNCGIHAIAVSGADFLVKNNTCISRKGVEYQTYYISGSGHIVKNNIGYRSDGISYVLLIPTSAISDYNCWFDPNNAKCISRWYSPMTLAEYQAYGQGLHSIFKDPKFIDILKTDFRLLPDSPCIKAGENGLDIGAFQTNGGGEMSRIIVGVNFVGRKATENSGEIRGKVTLEDGTDPSRVTISLTGSKMVSTNPDANGDFAFTGLPDGTYNPSAALEGYEFEYIGTVPLPITIPTSV